MALLANMSLPRLPIDAVLPQIVAAVRDHGAVVLRAPTGAGKTTRVPPALLDAGLAERGSIILLQPRRLTARACARRIAFERGGAVGETVGYQVRFDRCLGPNTRIEIVTEGILLRRLQDDPFLESTAAIIFDEFHQRSLNSEVALAMVQRVRQTVRPDLKVVVMSATLAPQPIAEYLGGCPVVESEGRLHPVEILYREDLDNRPLADRVATGVRHVLDATSGDILVFLPGVGEIRHAARSLQTLAEQRGLALMMLYGDLSPEQQVAALGPADRRKVVLATNVAETSLTIDGVTGVVDAGLARAPQFDPHVGMDRLQLIRVSQASADQRAGRAGRTQPGVCLRLWAQRTHRHRPAFEEPEIRRLDLTGPVLQLRAWGETDVAALPWFEAPSAGALAQADAMLRRLDAVDAAGHVTDIGRAMMRLSVSPRLGRMLVEGYRLGQPEVVALAAAMLSERDPLPSGDDKPAHRRNSVASSNSDVLDRVAALERFEQSGQSETPLGPLSRAAARFVLHAREQLLRELKRARLRKAGQACDADEAVMRSLLAAFPDRLVRRAQPGSRFGRMVGGRGVRQLESSAVREADLYLAVDVDKGQSEALVRKASAIEPAWLPGEHLVQRVEAEFDGATRRVIARRRTYWEDLLLAETPATLRDCDDAAAILAAAAAESFDDVFPHQDAATVELLNRLRCLREWMPDLNLPAVDDAALRGLLPQLCHGRRSLDELRRAPWRDAIEGQLSREQRAALDRFAPERIEVPSGNRIKLHYEPGKPPVLAVRIQEVFGLMETPRVAGGRVLVLLHLLAPNMRPQQVTNDLASFWKTTYHQVRKDLRQRYPKHAWPEDPYTATAKQTRRQR